MATKLPKQTSLFVPRSGDFGTVSAHAPYNFVPLPQQVVTVEGALPDHDRCVGYSGWIDCALETLSPTYVRGMLRETTFKKYDKPDESFDELPDDVQLEKAQFFAVNDRVAIPGSSLRGLIRAMVEMVSFGKMNVVSDKQMIFRAVGDPSSLGQYYREQVLGANKAPSPNNRFDYPSLSLQGGYLRQTSNGWAIAPALAHGNETIIHVEYTDAQLIGIQPSTQTRQIQTTHAVYVTPAQRKSPNRGRRGAGTLTLDVAVAPQGGVAKRSNGASKPSDMVEATLVVSGHMGGGHAKHWHCAIYAPDPAAKQIPISDDLWRVYEEDRDMTRGIPTRKLQKDGDALFYLLDSKDNLIFFGPTQMFRLPFGKSARDFVPASHRQEQDMDFAEAMFGYVGKGSERTESRAGRVFVGDARALDGQDDVLLSDDIITPKILGTPKPSTFQHYLVQPDAAANNKLSIQHYASETPGETVVRGHKLFWHSSNLAREQFEYPHARGSDERKQAKKQLTGIRPIKHGIKFEFRVNFENLSEVELGALLWALDLPADHAHKLGMAKPLGLGSVRMTPTLHVHERVSRYKGLFAGDGWQLGDVQPVTIAGAKLAFETHILARLADAEFDGARHTSFTAVPRIYELLCMLALPKDEADWFNRTKYMTIGDRNKGVENEYKSRPVLPLPSKVIGRAVPRPTITQTQNQVTAAPSVPVNWRTGSIMEIRPDRRYGRVRDMETQKEYRFDMSVIEGNMPANKSTVLFDLEGDRIRKLKRR